MNTFFGINLLGKHPHTDFITSKQLKTYTGELKICYESQRCAPATVAITKGTTAHIVKVKDALKSADLMNQLSINDQQTIKRLSKLNLPARPTLENAPFVVRYDDGTMSHLIAHKTQIQAEKTLKKLMTQYSDVKLFDYGKEVLSYA